MRKDIKRYLSGRERRDIMEEPDYTIANIQKKIAAVDLQFLSVFELYLTPRFTLESEALCLSTLTSESQHDDLARGGSNNRRGERSPRIIISKQASTSYSSNQLDVYRKALLGKLNDSV